MSAFDLAQAVSFLMQEANSHPYKVQGEMCKVQLGTRYMVQGTTRCMNKVRRAMTVPGVLENVRRLQSVYVDRDSPPAAKVTKTKNANITMAKS